MAKLHRRVPRLPHRVAQVHALRARELGTPCPAAHAPVQSTHATLTLRSAGTRAFVMVFAALLLAILPGVAEAQPGPPEQAAEGDPRLRHLEALLARLESPEEAERQAAYAALTTLDASMLPALRARLARAVRRRPDTARATEVFNRIRRAAGSERADDDVDIAPGVLAVLREDRSERVLQIVEPLLLWRALEHIGTFEAGQAMYPLIGLDDGLWRWEERRVVSRMGGGIMAAAIAGRNHPDAAVRAWASSTMRRLHADEPGLAVQELSHQELADVLRAYAMLRMQSAMRVVVSYVGSEQRTVRHAARWAIEQYGANAIWILRTEHHVKLGEHAPEQWGWRRVAEAIYAHADAQRMEPVRRAREAGLIAKSRGDLREMRARFDEVLARAPEPEDPAPLAEGYAALAAHEASPERRAWAYRRALRLAPEHPDSARWRGELAFARTERALEHGVLDEDRVRDVIGVAPDHDGARELLARAGAPETDSRDDRTRWGLVAAFLFALLGGALLWGGARRRDQQPDGSLDSTVDAPTLPDAPESTLVDSTLPG